MHSAETTYASSGVDIDLKGEFIRSLVRQLKFSRKSYTPAIGVGHFTSAINFGSKLLTLSTDGVGSKLLIARQMRKWDTVGIDCVAMNVNDTICIGAEPIALVDYVALPRLEQDIASDIGRGLNKGARMANASIVGGEVAVLTEMLNDIDLSASCLGMVDRRRIVTGRSIRKGDTIIGLPSSGLHSNGFTLVRKLLREKGLTLDEKITGGRRLGDVLMTPTRIYVREILRCIASGGVTGLANITGGGMRNILRLKSGVLFNIGSFPRIPAIFDLIRDAGNIGYQEMFQTFNMGVGFVVVCRQRSADRVIQSLRTDGLKPSVIGSVEEGHGVTLGEFGVHYDSY